MVTMTTRNKNRKVAQAGQRTRKKFFALAGKQLPQLYRLVRHEIAYLEDLGDVRRGQLTAEGIVDAALIRAYRDYVEHPRASMTGRLMRLAAEQVESDLERVKTEEVPHVEEDVPETAPAEEASSMGEEILFFYQPDVDLKLGDVMPDLKLPDPEQEAESRELNRCVVASLRAMPRLLRRALVLRYVEELKGAELAEALGRPESEVDGVLEQALVRLRESLRQAGCAFTGSAA